MMVMCFLYSTPRLLVSKLFYKKPPSCKNVLRRFACLVKFIMKINSNITNELACILKDFISPRIEKLNSHNFMEITLKKKQIRTSMCYLFCDHSWLHSERFGLQLDHRAQPTGRWSHLFNHSSRHSRLEEDIFRIMRSLLCFKKVSSIRATECRNR